MNIAKHPGLNDALCAMSFFRNRHKIQGAKRKHKRNRLQRDANHYREYVAMSLNFIRQARRAGWRGSIRETVMKLQREAEGAS